MRYPQTAKFVLGARRRKGLSQERLAAAIGSSRLQVIRWEQGLHRPDLDGLGAKLCEALEVDVADLAKCDAEDDEEAALMSPLTQAIEDIVAAQVRRLMNSNDRQMA